MKPSAIFHLVSLDRTLGERIAFAGDESCSPWCARRPALGELVTALRNWLRTLQRQVVGPIFFPAQAPETRVLASRAFTLRRNEQGSVEQCLMHCAVTVSAPGRFQRSTGTGTATTEPGRRPASRKRRLPADIFVRLIARNVCRDPHEFHRHQNPNGPERASPDRASISLTGLLARYRSCTDGRRAKTTPVWRGSSFAAPSGCVRACGSGPAASRGGAAFRDARR
jgi:hypothetical protein